MLHAETHLAVRHLLVLSEHVDGFFGVRHLLLNHLCCVGRYGGVRPELLDFVLCMVHIHITYNDDALVVRAIPLLVVVAEVLVREVVNNAHQTDWHTMTVF